MVVFPKTPILDTFNRADESPIGGNWTNDALGEGADNQLAIVSNQLKAFTAATSCEAYWNVQSFKGNIEAYFTVVTKPGDTQRVEIDFTMQPGNVTHDCYTARWFDNAGAGNDKFEIARSDASIETILVTNSAQEYNNGDVLGFSMRADGLLTLWQNGQSILRVKDNKLGGPFYIVLTIRDTTGVLDNFGGGNPEEPDFITNINGGTDLRPAPFRPGIAR